MLIFTKSLDIRIKIGHYCNLVVEMGKGIMNSIFTDRLELIPCSHEIGNIMVKNKNALKSILGLDISANWLLEEIKDFLRVYFELLQSDPSLLGWGIWIIVYKNEQKIIGDIGFKGKPDNEGNIEIGYYIVPEYRRHGYCHEASNELVEWAFKQSLVNKIIAECDRDNISSIRTLEKLNMDLRDRSESILKWELHKNSWVKAQRITHNDLF